MATSPAVEKYWNLAAAHKRAQDRHSEILEQISRLTTPRGGTNQSAAESIASLTKEEEQATREVSVAARALSAHEATLTAKERMTLGLPAQSPPEKR